MKLFKRAGKTILKVSKSEWVSIGRNHKWLTAAVAYKNKMGITFAEGGSLNLGSAGRVKIIKVNLDDKIATLEDETSKTLLMDMDTLEIVEDMEAYKAKKIEKARQDEEDKARRLNRGREVDERREQTRRRMDQLFTTEDRGFYLMGFIAANGILTAQVPSDAIEKYEQMYRKIKGQPPPSGSYEEAKPESKWAHQLRIHLPKNKVSRDIQSLFVNTFGFELRDTKTHYDINATEYVKRLLGLGFDIGRPNNQNVDAITKNIEQRYGPESSAQFEAGFLHT